MVEGKRHQILIVNDESIENEKDRLGLFFAPGVVAHEFAIEKVSNYSCNVLVGSQILAGIYVCHVKRGLNLPKAVGPINQQPCTCAFVKDFAKEETDSVAFFAN